LSEVILVVSLWELAILLISLSSIVIVLFLLFFFFMIDSCGRINSES
jgi:hypothetical protein